MLTSAGVRSALVRSGAEPDQWQPSSTFSRLVTRGTPIAAALLREARAEGLDLSGETCPHYLTFDAEHIADALLESDPRLAASAGDLKWERSRSVTSR